MKMIIIIIIITLKPVEYAISHTYKECFVQIYMIVPSEQFLLYLSVYVEGFGHN